MLEMNLDRLFILQQISGTYLNSMEAGSLLDLARHFSKLLNIELSKIFSTLTK
jgi:hypothetical protein